MEPGERTMTTPSWNDQMPARVEEYIAGILRAERQERPPHVSVPTEDNFKQSKKSIAAQIRDSI